MAEDLVPVDTALAARTEAIQRRHFRSEVLDRLRSAALALDDQVQSLVEAGELEALAEGGQDLQALVGDLQTVQMRVRTGLGELVDAQHDHALFAKHADKLDAWQAKVDAAVAAGRKPPKEPAPLKLKDTGPKRVEVEGVGMIECNGGWTRKGWESERLLRELVASVLERAITEHGEMIVNVNGELVPIADSATLADLMTMLTDCLPITASTSWRTGQRKPDGTVTGLVKHHFDDADYCARESKPRLATIPKTKGA